jgi:replicative DNA helicase
MPGHLWVVGGYTSHGKSAFAVELISRVLSNSVGAHIALFSTEMSKGTYLLRLVANPTGIPSFVILQGNHISGVQKKIDEAFGFIGKKNLIIFDDVYRFKEIAEKSKNIKTQIGLDLLFIDFIQNVVGEGSLYERMALLAPQLQALAKELSCTVVAMSQVSNEAVKDNSGLIGFKGAGEIAAAADLGLWLERERDKKEGFKLNGEILNVFIRKNRHGPTGKSTLKFCGNFTRLDELNNV